MCFQIFTTWILSFNKHESIYGTNTYKQTYIHTHIHTYIQTDKQTDTACVQHVNVGLAQAHPNYLVG